MCIIRDINDQISALERVKVSLGASKSKTEEVVFMLVQVYNLKFLLYMKSKTNWRIVDFSKVLKFNN